MTPASLTLLSLAMSTDAFAASIGRGAGSGGRPRFLNALRTGAIFGAIEGITPIIGWLAGAAAVHLVSRWDHWIAFVLLVGLGARMVYAGMGKAEGCEEDAPRQSLPMVMLAAVATSIDALVVGVSLAFVDIHIAVAATAIGTATMVMVTLGIMLGCALGQVVGKRAEILGGLVLIAIGAGTLYQHLGADALTG
ncbi:manganese efflux pump MntP [Kushneria pakistanensis]|nr:manganese efflux pump MntP family protein [Kushneria pakistanensis]